jgi:hypothetical protein
LSICEQTYYGKLLLRPKCRGINGRGVDGLLRRRLIPQPGSRKRIKTNTPLITKVQISHIYNYTQHSDHDCVRDTLCVAAASVACSHSPDSRSTGTPTKQGGQGRPTHLVSESVTNCTNMPELCRMGGSHPSHQRTNLLLKPRANSLPARPASLFRISKQFNKQILFVQEGGLTDMQRTLSY